MTNRAFICHITWDCSWLQVGKCISAPHAFSQVLLEEQPPLGTQYSQGRGKKRGGRNNAVKLLLGHDVLHVRSLTRSWPMLFTPNVSVSGMGRRSLGGSERRTAIGRDVKYKKGIVNAWKQSYHRNMD